MSKEKQIEECYDLEEIIYMSGCGLHRGYCYAIANQIQEQGYRKQSEGEWIYHECVSSYDGVISGYSCSECCVFVNEETFDSDEFHKSFCGNCGAKMKGGDDNDRNDT